MIKDRKKIRLENYNYSSNGYYFLTICIKNKEKLLCKIVGDGAYDVPKTLLSEEGKIAEKYILSTNKIKGVCVDKYVIMPNHIHLMIKIEDEEGTSTFSAAASVGASAPQRCPPDTRTAFPTNEKIPHIVSTFKRFVNKETGKDIFQRSYIDHIIRNEEDYINHLKYIEDNVFKWQEDELYV